MRSTSGILGDARVTGAYGTADACRAVCGFHRLVSILEPRVIDLDIRSIDRLVSIRIISFFYALKLKSTRPARK